MLKKANTLGIKRIYARQDDSEGRIYKIFDRIAREKGGELNCYVSEKDADFEYIPHDMKVIQQFSSRPIVKLDPEEVDPATFSPLFLELII